MYRAVIHWKNRDGKGGYYNDYFIDIELYSNSSNLLHSTLIPRPSPLSTFVE